MIINELAYTILFFGEHRERVVKLLLRPIMHRKKTNCKL